MTNQSTTPINTSFADEEEVTFNHTPAQHGAAPSSSTLSTEPDIQFVERPKPVGLRDAYVSEIAKITSREGKVSIKVDLQIADADFPVSESNKPLALWLAIDDLDKAEAVAKVLGITLDDLSNEAGRAKGKGIHCRVFVTAWQGKVQIARFAPFFNTRKPADAKYWEHVDSLGITAEQYKDLTKNFCGIIPPR